MVQFFLNQQSEIQLIQAVPFITSLSRLLNISSKETTSVTPLISLTLYGSRKYHLQRCKWSIIFRDANEVHELFNNSKRHRLMLS